MKAKQDMFEIDIDNKMNKKVRLELKLKKRNHLVAIVMQKGVKKHKNKKKNIDELIAKEHVDSYLN